jgi:hypothetical protein
MLAGLVNSMLQCAILFVVIILMAAGLMRTVAACLQCGSAL